MDGLAERGFGKGHALHLLKRWLLRRWVGCSILHSQLRRRGGLLSFVDDELRLILHEVHQLSMKLRMSFVGNLQKSMQHPRNSHNQPWSKGGILAQFPGSLPERFELQHNFALLLLQDIKAWAPAGYWCPLAWMFWVVLQ